MMEKYGTLTDQMTKALAKVAEGERSEYIPIFIAQGLVELDPTTGKYKLTKQGANAIASKA